MSVKEAGPALGGNATAPPGVASTSASGTPFDPSTVETGDTATGVTSPWAVTGMPAVPQLDGGGGSGKFGVNTDAMRTVAKNLSGAADTVNSLFTQVREAESGHPVRAGYFYQGRQLTQGVNPGSGAGNDAALIPAYRVVLNGVVNSLLDTSTLLTSMAKAFDDGEDANAMSAESITESFSDVASDIAGLTSAAGDIKSA